MQLTEAEQKFLLEQPDVAATLARFNRAKAMQEASEPLRMELVKRTRTFEQMSRRDYR
jgi:hypothetical protein